MVGNAKWTFMVYMAAECGLADMGAGDDDLDSMRVVGSTPDVNIVVELDNGGDEGSNRYHVKRRGNDLVEKLGNIDSGSPKTLSDFIAWSMDNYAAEKYSLVLWSHGSGWEPWDKDDGGDKGTRGFKANETEVPGECGQLSSRTNRPFFSTTRKKASTDNRATARFICRDDGSHHALDMVELSGVLAEVIGKLGNKLDLLGMDACFMSNLEVAYQMEPFARYMVASEEEEPNIGWPFDAVLRNLVGRPSLEARDLASNIVSAFIAECRRQKKTQATQSAMDLSKTKEVASAMDVLASSLMAHIPESAEEISQVQDKLKNVPSKFYMSTLWDINRFSKELQKTTTDDAVIHAAQCACDLLEAGQDNLIIAESHIGQWYDECRGASIYLIPPPRGVSPYYADIEFAKKTHWLSMLQAYHNHFA